MIKSGTTPVVLCGNYSENIPWRIRNNKNMTVLEMSNKQISNQMLFNRLMDIATAEGFSPSIDGVKKIVKVCPTIRASIKTLQICCLNDEWDSIYPRDIDGSEDMRILGMIRGEAAEPAIKDTFRIMNFALVNNVPLHAITKMNRLSMIRRSVPAFDLHERFATTGLTNPKLENLVKPKWIAREKQHMKKTEERRKKKEESKRKALLKKIQTQKTKMAKKAAKKTAKSSSTSPIEGDWGDLF